MGLQSITVELISIHSDWVSCAQGGGSGVGVDLVYLQTGISRVFFFWFESRMSIKFYGTGHRCCIFGLLNDVLLSVLYFKQYFWCPVISIRYFSEHSSSLLSYLAKHLLNKSEIPNFTDPPVCKYAYSPPLGPL